MKTAAAPAAFRQQHHGYVTTNATNSKAITTLHFNSGQNPPVTQDDHIDAITSESASTLDARDDDVTQRGFLNDYATRRTTTDDDSYECHENFGGRSRTSSTPSLPDSWASLTRHLGQQELRREEEIWQLLGELENFFNAPPSGSANPISTPQCSLPEDELNEWRSNFAALNIKARPALASYTAPETAFQAVNDEANLSAHYASTDDEDEQNLRYAYDEQNLSSWSTLTRSSESANEVELTSFNSMTLSNHNVSSQQEFGTGDEEEDDDDASSSKTIRPTVMAAAAITTEADNRKSSRRRPRRPLSSFTPNRRDRNRNQPPALATNATRHPRRAIRRPQTAFTAGISLHPEHSSSTDEDTTTADSISDRIQRRPRRKSMVRRQTSRQPLSLLPSDCSGDNVVTPGNYSTSTIVSPLSVADAVRDGIVFKTTQEFLPPLLQQRRLESAVTSSSGTASHSLQYASLRDSLPSSASFPVAGATNSNVEQLPPLKHRLPSLTQTSQPRVLAAVHEGNSFQHLPHLPPMFAVERRAVSTNVERLKARFLPQAQQLATNHNVVATLAPRRIAATANSALKTITEGVVDWTASTITAPQPTVREKQRSNTAAVAVSRSSTSAARITNTNGLALSGIAISGTAAGDGMSSLSSRSWMRRNDALVAVVENALATRRGRGVRNDI